MGYASFSTLQPVKRHASGCHAALGGRERGLACGSWWGGISPLAVPAPTGATSAIAAAAAVVAPTAQPAVAAVAVRADCGRAEDGGAPRGDAGGRADRGRDDETNSGRRWCFGGCGGGAGGGRGMGAANSVVYRSSGGGAPSSSIDVGGRALAWCKNCSRRRPSFASLIAGSRFENSRASPAAMGVRPLNNQPLLSRPTLGNPNLLMKLVCSLTAAAAAARARPSGRTWRDLLIRISE